MELTLDNIELSDEWLLCQRRHFKRQEKSEGGIYIPENNDESPSEPLLWEVSRSNTPRYQTGDRLVTDAYAGVDKIFLQGSNFHLVRIVDVRAKFTK